MSPAQLEEVFSVPRSPAPSRDRRDPLGTRVSVPAWLPGFLVAALSLFAPAIPAAAEDPAPPYQVTITKVESSSDDQGVRFLVEVDARVPAGTSIRLGLALDGRNAGFTMLSRDATGDPLVTEWGPYPGLPPGLYAVAPQVLEPDQPPDLWTRCPELARCAIQPRNVRLGAEAEEAAGRAQLRAVFVESGRALRDLWIGLWHRAEWSRGTIRFLKGHREKDLTDAKRAQVGRGWRDWVEGECWPSYSRIVTRFEEVAQNRAITYYPEARDALSNVIAVLRRARAIYWRDVATITRDTPPQDTQSEPNVPPASLVRNAAEAFRALAKGLPDGAGAGFDVLPEFPAQPRDAQRVAAEGARRLSWPGLGATLALPEGWEADTAPGVYPALCRLSGPGGQTAEFRLIQLPGLGADPQLAASLEAAAGRGGKDAVPVDPRVTSAAGRRLIATAAPGADGAKLFQVGEIDERNGRVLSLRWTGPAEDDFRAFLAVVGWPGPPAARPEDPPEKK